MALPIKFRGDTIEMILQLRQLNQIIPQITDQFSLPLTYQIDVYLPNDPTLQPSGAVVASTLNVGEITVIDANLSTIKATFVPTKTANCLVTATAAVDVKVTDLVVTPNKVTTFEKVKVLQIKDRENL